MNIIRNLDQIRAKNAYKAARVTYAGIALTGENQGEVVKKIPVFIRDNGLLATLAFALERNKKGEYDNKGYYNVFEAVVVHLKECKIIEPGINSPEALFEKLTGQTAGNGNIDLALTLRWVTSETLAYMDYLRRFVERTEKKRGND